MIEKGIDFHEFSVSRQSKSGAHSTPAHGSSASQPAARKSPLGIPLSPALSPELHTAGLATGTTAYNRAKLCCFRKDALDLERLALTRCRFTGCTVGSLLSSLESSHLSVVANMGQWIKPKRYCPGTRTSDTAPARLCCSPVPGRHPGHPC